MKAMGRIWMTTNDIVCAQYFLRAEGKQEYAEAVSRARAGVNKLNQIQEILNVKTMASNVKVSMIEAVLYEQN